MFETIHAYWMRSSGQKYVVCYAKQAYKTEPLQT